MPAEVGDSHDVVLLLTSGRDIATSLGLHSLLCLVVVVAAGPEGAFAFSALRGTQGSGVLQPTLTWALWALRFLQLAWVLLSG